MSAVALTASTGSSLRDVVPFSIVATGTILIYDLLCTLDDEVEYVWKARQNLGTNLYYLNRYTPFIDTFISLDLLTGRHSPQACERNFKVVLWLIVLGTLISESILCLRTYALWERRKSIGIALFVVYGALFGSGIGIVALEANSLHYGPPPLPNIPGCFLRSASPIVFVDYVLVLVAETIVVILTVIKALEHLRHTRSPLVVTLYRDGILFYFILLAITIVNVIIPLVGPPELTNWLATPQRVIHSILCTRVLLFILKSRQRQKPSSLHPDRTSLSTSRTPSTNVLSSIATFVSPSHLLESAPAHWSLEPEFCGHERSREEPAVVEMDDFDVDGGRRIGAHGLRGGRIDEGDV